MTPGAFHTLAEVGGNAWRAVKAIVTLSTRRLDVTESQFAPQTSPDVILRTSHIVRSLGQSDPNRILGRSYRERAPQVKHTS